ncbi:VOC family protein [Bogoriella caseilytica]|uniref:PhnB protein n=1 Tax=Bogoriella caseilytica TaxID=56055 RepID=A0A3N2BGL3_9MICO|nr:VOC family protein [Bogoriella caseilytica]ROR74377.1 PhnB protein [Bogoriella caseilytica]
MALVATTHVNFPGTARAALDFYQSAFGGHVHTTTYGDLGMPPEAPDAEKLVFGQLEAESGFRLMAYDIPGRTEGFSGSTYREQGATITDRPFFVSVRGETLEEIDGPWKALQEGGEVIEPLAASAWSAGFGMLTDRFGVTWVLDVQAARG